MFIRCTTIKSKQHGEPYKTYRLAESQHLEGKVRQHTLLNLGRHFDVPKAQWRDLSQRISELLNSRQGALLEMELDTVLEARAQRYAAQILASRSQADVHEGENAYESVCVDSLELVRPRRVGVEHLALQAASQLQLAEKLKELGFNRHQLAAALGNIIGRMAFPASERATLAWLQQRSGLGELIGYDFEGIGLDRLYQVSDQLWKHREVPEDHLYARQVSLFGLGETITLYDLTNTFFKPRSLSGLTV